MKDKLKITRKFLGKTEGFENKEERDFENKHLRAYLRGKTHFRHGYHNVDTPFGVIRLPKWFEVKQELKFI